MCSSEVRAAPTRESRLERAHARLVSHTPLRADEIPLDLTRLDSAQSTNNGTRDYFLRVQGKQTWRLWPVLLKVDETIKATTEASVTIPPRSSGRCGLHFSLRTRCQCTLGGCNEQLPRMNGENAAPPQMPRRLHNSLTAVDSTRGVP